MNIIVGMVGRGTRVQNKYNCPKPLIKLNGKTIIEHCIESLNIDGNYIFVIRKFSEYGELSEQYTNELKHTLKRLKPACNIIQIEYVTQGAAESCLLAKDLIDNPEPLLIVNCDQTTPWNSNKFLEFINNPDIDGCVTTYPHENIELNKPSPYSFVELNKDGYAIRFEEKFAISEHALNGIHYFSHGNDFVAAAEEMIKNDDRCNNEFYISKVFNYFCLKNNKKVVIYKMLKDEFYALGNEHEIQHFLNEKI